MKRAAGYIRVSSAGQATEDKTSPQNQEKKIRAYCKDNKLKLIGISKDLGISGKSIEKRLGFQGALQDAKAGRFDVLVAYSLSRFARSARDFQNAQHELKDVGVELRLVKENVDPNTPHGKLFLGIMAVLAEWERESTHELIAENQLLKLENGTPLGRKPFARTWDKEKKEWVLDEGLRKKVQRAARDFTKGVPLAKVAKKIGIKYDRLRHVLLNSCGDKWTYTMKKEGKTFVFDVPRLLEDADIEKVKEQFEKNKNTHHGQIKYKYLLGRMIFCGHCGESLSGIPLEREKKLYRYYKHIKPCPEGGFKKMVPADMIEKMVMQKLFKLQKDPGEILRAMKKAVGPSNADRLEQELTELEKQRKLVDNKIEKLLDAVEKGSLSDATIKKRDRAYTEELKIIDSEIEKVKTELSGLLSTKQLKERAKIITSRNWGKTMSWDEQREVVQALFTGRDRKGERRGVYVERKNDQWNCTLKGVFGEYVVNGKSITKFIITKALNLRKRDSVALIRNTA